MLIKPVPVPLSRPVVDKCAKLQSAPYQEHTDFLAKNPAPKAEEF